VYGQSLDGEDSKLLHDPAARNSGVYKAPQPPFKASQPPPKAPPQQPFLAPPPPPFLAPPPPPPPRQAPSSLELTVATLSGKAIAVDGCAATDTVLAVKLWIEAAEGIPPEQQRLLLGAEQVFPPCKAPPGHKLNLHAALLYSCIRPPIFP
jgi:hypothetical protein